MHILNVAEVTPAQAPHGEAVQELIGRAAGGSAAYSLAQITLPPGAASLKHYHPIAEECYHVLSGTGHIEIDGMAAPLGPGDAVAILPGQIHQITNTGETDLIFLAVCVPAWTPDNSLFVD